MPLEPRDLRWAPETPDARAWRRFCLHHVDALLTAIEEHNVTVGGDAVVPIRLWRWYQVLAGDRELGVDPESIDGALLMEAALGLQETLLRAAEPAWVVPARQRSDLARELRLLATPSPCRP